MSKSEIQNDIVQLILLRKYIENIQESVSQKEFQVLQKREELDANRVRLDALQAELSSVNEKINAAKEKNNNASYYRLIGQKEKLQSEIGTDKELEDDIRNTLSEYELELSRVEIEQRHYTDLVEQLSEQEVKVEEYKNSAAKMRLGKEQQANKMEIKRWENAKRIVNEHIASLREYHQTVLDSAAINHVKATKFLDHSLSAVKAQQKVEEDWQDAHMEDRITGISSLKENIELNRENLQALQARDASIKQARLLAEKIERQNVLAEGGNPELLLLTRKKYAEFEQQKLDFNLQQKENKEEIVARLLREEEAMEKRRRTQPQLWGDDPIGPVKPIREQTPLTAKLALDDNNTPVFLQHEAYLSRPSKNISHIKLETGEGYSPQSMMTDHTTATEIKFDEHDDEDLALPEFEGLWGQDVKEALKIPTKPTSAHVDSNNKDSRTPMEKEILAKVLKKHREGIIVKQVAAGREFTGQPFMTNPSVIHFADLDVGKTYKKRILITNVSYSINFIKLTGLSEHLKDFIKIEFHPPGQMSAGMSCDMHVTFKPMINEDLVGEVFFMAQTGRFTVPLKCTTRKCQPSVDMSEVDFGVQVIGETVQRTIMLTNKGALSSYFEFQRIPDRPATTYTADTSLGKMTPNSEVAANAEEQKEEGEWDEGIPQQQEGEEGTENEEEVKEKEDDISFNIPSHTETPDIDEMRVGKGTNGELAPFSSVPLGIIFSPSYTGDVSANFKITFSDAESIPIHIKAKAQAINVPVWLEKPNMDLKICMYDRLYQDQIVAHNRSSTALRLKFEVPKKLAGHLEILPKTGFIQAKSSFLAQLKFLPRKTLAGDSPELFDADTGVLEAPMMIRVADQTRPVHFTTYAVLTSSDLRFETRHIDFGNCTIYEQVTHAVKLTNCSKLPQNFGFVNVPDFVSVQPNDGFGVILPEETIQLDVIVQVKRAGVYNFTVICRTGINNDFPLHCSVVGVHPPLELSHQRINFAATALDDVSTAHFFVVNSHTSANEFTHPVPRIGKGDICPVGPTSFEFIIPDGYPVSMNPVVGTVKPGEKCLVSVEFFPKLSDAAIREEAVKMLERRKEEKIARALERVKMEEELAAQKREEEDKTPKGRKSKTGVKQKATADAGLKSGKNSGKNSVDPTSEVIPSADEIDPKSSAYKSAKASLARSFPGEFQFLSIPCFIAQGTPSANLQDSLPYNPANNLYLELNCPAIRPPVVVISNDGDPLTDFGQISIGRNTIKPISIQNISQGEVDLRISALDTSGPFQMLNALRTLKPNETHTILVSFTPTAGKKSFEVLKITSGNSVLELCLTGKGVTPVIKLSPDEPTIDLGHVVQGEEITSTFSLVNESPLSVKFSIQMDSSSLLRHELQQHLPEFVEKNDIKQLFGRSLSETPSKQFRRNFQVGTQNYNGTCVFDCVPREGEILSGESCEVTITFHPDHRSHHYADSARIILFETEEAHVLHLHGKAENHMWYIDGGDQLDVDTEFLEAEKRPDPEATEPKPESSDILVSFTSSLEEDGGFKSVERELTIGCIRSNVFAGKKGADWSVDNFQAAQAKGFVVDTPKASVDVDSSKVLKIQWNPLQGHDPNSPLQVSFNLTMRGDATVVYKVILTGLISFT